MKGSSGPSHARRNSVACGDEIEVRLLGTDKVVRRRRSISFLSSDEVYEVTPIRDLAKKTKLWFQKDDIMERKLRIRKILKRAETANCNAISTCDEDMDDDSFCLRGIECHMANEAKWRTKTIGALYDNVLDAQSVQRTGGMHDSFQLAGFSERISEQSRQLAVERALADAMAVEFEHQCHKRCYARRRMTMGW